ncbi:MAG TPA: peroxidase family protein [Frankiaceae bacterium]|nr:peroxidase family protein [Frankiaceae bacterium]
MAVTGVPALVATTAQAAPVGNGFTVTAGDLSFILKQIKIAERHTTTLTPSNPCGTLLNQPGDGIPDAEQVPDIITSYGLRTVDGSCNNLKDTTTAEFAASDQVFPRLTTPVWRTPTGDLTFPVPSTPTYLGTGNVVDTAPRTISNLIDDQTSTNPAAIAAAGKPVRSQDPNTPSAVVCTTDPAPLPPATPTTPGVPAGCTPSHKTLFIPNITTDVGLSPPFNSLFTFFGQFFDHGVDQTVKSGSSVFVPLRPDDPLITLGPDGVPNSGDEVNPANGNAFMVLTRAQNQPGAVQNATNTDTPWVDQSQTYTSHASHQVFLRQYSLLAGPDQIVGTADDTTVPGTRPVATGSLLAGLPAGQTYAGSPDMTDGESTWASVKKQAADVLGLKLVDADVTNVPMLATDPYGKFLPGPHGLPQYVTTGHGLVEGNLASPVLVPADVVHFDTPFVADIAHNADPSPQDTDNNPATPPVAPVPDADNTPSADFASQPPGTYDDEMLNAHASCGDGRCNENIALTSIHQVFHSEHNRLVNDINTTLHQPGNESLLAGYQGIGVSGTNSTGSYNYGERLFQAARFVTEMEYQHLVFEEFARKVQPAVRPFHVYSPDINPAIEAEFAHAVYRFGHSMLDDTVARTNVNPTTGAQSDNSIPLLNAFLNPPELYDGGSAGTLSASRGAGSVLMGSSDQTGNEIDEFVTETLRNNLLGLPLDLPAINMARAREAGVPPLNDVRRQIFAQTNDGQLAPYTSWSDFGQHLKHPESLINFVAAYGTHPSITSQTTLAGKRRAARAIVDPVLAPSDPADIPPTDAADFMFSTGAWSSNAQGVTNTGLDDVDLWVGGLAEVTNLFGGMLGSTFNYVFQTQLEKLQDGDRLYYLARTPGLNLRTQLEGNSFSEMIQRNTEGTNSLKADAFATADCKFQLSNLSGTPAGFAAQGATVTDDPSTPDCNENLLLQRKPDGTIQYKAINPVDPPGINGQSVYNGTANADRIFGGNDNDTFWGNAGNDVIEGGGGDDIALGGDGNDIITDLAGADVLKGGPGNDAIDAGIGDDIIMGADGSDFLNGGANDNEEFAGPGNDYVIAGQGADAVFGDGGDDWIEGGTGQDLLQGDHGAPFFDDPGELAPGNDIFIGQPGENDYDAEGGDDIMAQNAAIDRNAGAGGFDWAIHQYDTVAADDDMMINNNLGGLPIQVIVNRDRWQETEADSGGPLNDVIKGTDGVLSTPRLITGGGFTGCDALDQAGVNRISGLAALLPPTNQWLGTAAETSGLSVTGQCPLSGPVWGEGDILLGGTGSDTITGRTGDEIIDGDKQLRVAITVRNAAGAEIGRTDLMEGTATSGNFGPGTAGMTLQQAVFAGLVDPGKLVNVREIVNLETHPADCGAAVPLNCDTSVYAGPRSQYTITTNAAHVTTVIDTTTVTPAVAGVVAKGDGTDTLFNIERLQFSDGTVPVPPASGGGGPTTIPGAPAAPTAVAGNASVQLSFAAPLNTGGGPITSFQVVVNAGAATAVQTITGIDPASNTLAITGLTNGTSYTFQVRAVNAIGPGPLSVTSSPVTPAGAVVPTAPAAPAIGTPTAGNAQVTVRWNTPANGGSPITSYRMQVRTGATVVRTITGIAPGAPGTQTRVVTGLTNGTAYNFRVQAVNAIGTGPLSAASVAVTPATVPAAPVIGVAVAGTAGGAITATARWTPAGNTGGAPITGFRVTALRLNAAGAVLSTTVSAVQPAAARTLAMTLPVAGNYRFTVQSINRVGTSAASARSNLVAGR